MLSNCIYLYITFVNYICKQGYFVMIDKLINFAANFNR